MVGKSTIRDLFDMGGEQACSGKMEVRKIYLSMCLYAYLYLAALAVLVWLGLT